MSEPQAGHERPFRFGVQCARATTREGWREKARRAEDLGFDVFLLPDHVGTQLAPAPALVSAAEATTRVKVGVLVFDNDFRHPLLLAHEMASVDLLVEGRLEIGLGGGWLGRDYTTLGIPFETGKVRFERLREAVEIVDRYLEGARFSYSGEHYSVADVEPVPLPTRPSLLIAGGGPRLLRLAAERADIVGVFLKSLPDGSGFDVSGLSPGSFQRTTDRVRRLAREAGRDPELNVLVQHVELTNDRMAAAARRADEYDGEVATLLGLPFELIGTAEQIAADLAERRRRYGISYITVFERHMDDMAQVIPLLG